MTQTGVITGSITPDWRGDTLIADVSAGATVLPVQSVVDFDKTFTERRYLVVGDETTPREYVAVDTTANTVTLASTVGGTGLEDDLPVVLWDPTVGKDGSRAVEYVAQVELHDGSGAPDVTIPHALIPASGVYGLVGASVSIEEDEQGDWSVAKVLGRENVAGLVQTAAEGQPNRIVLDTDNSIKFYGSTGEYEGQIYGQQGVQIEGLGGAFVRLGSYHAGETVIGGSGGLSVNQINVISGGGDLTIGSDVTCDGSVSANNDISAGGDVTGTRIFATSPDTTDNAANVRFGTGGQLLLSSSSAAKYKDNIKPLTDEDLDPEVVVQLTPHSWTYRPEHCSSTSEQWGAIADHADDLGLTKFVEYDEQTGEVENFRYDRWPMAQQAVLRQHHQRIADLEELVARLTARVERLEAR